MSDRMYAQLTWFDGPRNPALVAAADRADRERIRPALAADPTVAAGVVEVLDLRTADGGQLVVVVARSTEVLERAREVITGTELLPGEDPMLLPGPDRVEVLEVALRGGLDATPA